MDSSTSKNQKNDLKVLPQRYERIKSNIVHSHEANAKANSVVLQLIEEGVTEDFLSDKVKFIDKTHYDDVTTERSIARLCGYPLCDAFVDTTQKQQYIIRRNRVYDITSRCKFCSDKCFEASEIILSQIPSTPLYLRTSDQAMKEFQLIIPDRTKLKGQYGTLVNITGVSMEPQNADIPENSLTEDYVYDIKDLERELDNVSLNYDNNAKDSSTKDIKIQSAKISQTSNSTESLSTAHISDRKDLGGVDDINRKTDKKSEILSEKYSQISSLTRDRREILNKSSSDVKNCSSKLESIKSEVWGSGKSNKISKVKFYDRVSSENQKSTIRENFNCVENHKNTSVSDTKMMESDTESFNSQSCGEKNNQLDKDSQLGHILELENYLRDWMTFESLRLILGDFFVKGMLEELGKKFEDYQNDFGTTLSVDAKAKYIKLCKQIDANEFKENIRDSKNGSSNSDCDYLQKGDLRPLPDYEHLKSDLEENTAKVRAFFLGREESEVKVLSIDENSKNERLKESKNYKIHPKDVPCNGSIQSENLPLIDDYSQEIWRLQIVSNRIIKPFLTHITELDLDLNEMQSLLSNLLASFNFTPHNINLNVRQWNLAALVMIKLISIRYPTVQAVYKVGSKSLAYINNILNSYCLDPEYLDRLLSFLTEISFVLSKQYFINSKNNQVKVSTPEADSGRCESDFCGSSTSHYSKCEELD